MEAFEFETPFVSKTLAIVLHGRYGDGSAALEVMSEYGKPLTRATVCLDAYNEKPSDGYVFIYGDYSEHVGVQAALQKAGVVGPIGRIVRYGPYDACAYECKLLRDDLVKL